MAIRDLIFGSEKKEVRETSAEAQRNQRYLDFITTTALPELQAGRQWCLADVYHVFVMERAGEHQKLAAQYFDGLLDAISLPRLWELEQQFRRTDWMYDGYNRSYDWKQADVSRGRFPMLSDREYEAVLKIGTFHANGYYRQRCMEMLGAGEGTLPFLFLRLNDWVEDIRKSAFALIRKRVPDCGAEEFYLAVSCMEKVKRSGRRAQRDVAKLEQMMEDWFAAHSDGLDLRDVRQCSIVTRNAIYRMAYGKPVFRREQMEFLLGQEQGGYGKRILIQGILRHYGEDGLDTERYLRDKSAAVRRCALEYRYEKRKASWPGLEEMLLDKSSWIRAYAGDILSRHEGISLWDYYREQLIKSPSAAAIWGVGQYGGEEDAESVLHFLEDGRVNVAAAAMTAAGNLKGEDLAELYWRYLSDARLSVAKRAYRNIRTWNIRYGAECLYKAYRQHASADTARYYVLLLLSEDSWKRLPWLLRLYETEDDGLRELIHKKINQRSMYASLSSADAAAVNLALEETEGVVPLRIQKEIRLDFKHLIS